MMSLRDFYARSALFRFTLLFGVIFATGSAIAFYLAYSTVSAYTQARVQDTMETDMRGFRDIFTASGLAGLTSAVTLRSQDQTSPRVYLLVSDQGEKIAGNFESWPNNLPADQNRISFSDPEGHQKFDGAATLLSGNIRLLIAHNRAEHEALLAGLRRELALPALLALIVAMAAGYLVSRRLLARINALNATCKAVEAGDVSARATGYQSLDEFGQLAASVNAMLARIAVLMRSVHDLSDHVAHEMRTPLARLRSRLERARRDIGPDSGGQDSAKQDSAKQDSAKPDLERRASAPPNMVPVAEIAHQAFDGAINETQKIIDMFSALLDIAAAESAAGDIRGLKPVDLAQTVADVVDIYDVVAEDRSITLEVITASAAILGEPILLMRMVANVVDNALKFAPVGGKVSISLSVSGADAVLQIADNGKGIAAEFQGNAFERFARADGARQTPGHGLGLTLVRAIALRHGLHISLEDNAPGLRVIFRGRLVKDV